MSANNRTRPITTTCPRCKKRQTIMVDFADLQKWDEGALIQVAFPYLTKNEREALQTGICSDCWKAVFNVEEE